MSQSHESLSSEPSRWEILSRVEPFACPIFSFEKKRCRHPVRMQEGDFYTIRTAEWVNVVAVTPEQKLVLVRRYRFGIEALSLEVPGGIIDLGEDPVDAGIRELREETGFVGQRARVIGKVHPNPAIQSNTCHIVLVEDVVQSAETDWDAKEELSLQVESMEEVYRKVDAGEITHALALNALFCYERLTRGSFGEPRQGRGKD